MRKMRQVERTELSDQRMVEAAIAIILRRGISGLRLTEVGLRAGYSRGLATMRFRTMGRLLRRVAERLGNRWISAVTEAVGNRRGLMAISAAIDTQQRILEPPASSIRVQYLILFNSLDPGASDRLNAARPVAAQRRDLARWIREAVEDGEAPANIDPEAEAASILSTMIGMIFQSLLDDKISPKVLCAKLKADIAARFDVPPRDSVIPASGFTKHSRGLRIRA
jgi:AcrR family transcriptional regulator